MLSKQSADSNVVYEQDLGGSQLEHPMNKLDKSSIYASKLSFKH